MTDVFLARRQERQKRLQTCNVSNCSHQAMLATSYAQTFKPEEPSSPRLQARASKPEPRLVPPPEKLGWDRMMKVKQCSVESLKMKTRGVNQLNFCRNRIFAPRFWVLMMRLMMGLEANMGLIWWLKSNKCSSGGSRFESELALADKWHLGSIRSQLKRLTRKLSPLETSDLP